MTLLQIRELLPFPKNPENATDTVINDVHFNSSALNHFNYTLYSNRTLSNGTNCWLAFENYKPHMLWNGTFVNGTSCYTPIDGIEVRGSVGIAFATMFAATILFSVVNLKKHGSKFLPIQKRWRAVGRRWQWYWMLFLATCGTISCFMSIDVDRDYLQSTAIMLQSFFYHLMLPVMLAAIWESVRHWGSWQERQACDQDSFAFPAATTRERQELYMPLVFYLFGFLNFFLTIPRSWSPIQKQRSPSQQELVAKPAATDERFKAGSILAIVCLFIITYSLGHSLYRYKHRPQGRSPFTFYLAATPIKFILVIVFATIRVAFNIASSFKWSLSPLKYNGDSGYLYGLGYAPILLILIVFNIYGFIDPNEDKELIKQRIERGYIHDAELGIEAGKRKPNWWRRMRLDFNNVSGTDPESRLRALASEVGGGKPTTKNMERLVELGIIEGDRYRDAEGHGPRGGNSADPFSDETHKAEAKTERDENYFLSGPEDEFRNTRMSSNAGSQFTTSSGETLTHQVKQQKVRSMLDI